VEGGVGLAVVGFLVDDEALRSAGDQLGVLVVLHGPDLDPEGRDGGREKAQAVLEVAVRDKLGVLAGDEEEISEAEFPQVKGFAGDLCGRERGAEDGIVARESAVTAVIDALVGKVKRCEEAHGAAEFPAREVRAASGEVLQAVRGEGFQEGREAAQEGGFQAARGRKLGRKAHGGRGRVPGRDCQRGKFPGNAANPARGGAARQINADWGGLSASRIQFAKEYSGTAEQDGIFVLNEALQPLESRGVGQNENA